MVPFRATVRLQLHAGFTFDDARAQLDYYADLGISHLYLSPIARAVDGSTHGYDVIDPTVVNPALGGEPALQALAAAARGHGMGLVLDIVPNHVAAHPANPWWADVLANGHHSRHADWFDINWRAPGRGGKLWLPVLGQPLPAAIAAGEVAIQRDADGVAGLVVHGQRYPLAAQTQAEARPGMDAAALAALLDVQAYRLAWWRSGDTQINYRRFFTIASLAALQVERDEVFDAVHALPLRLAAQGVIDGVRVDHVDGLRDPGTYLQRLRTALDVAGVSRGLSSGALGLWVEKILAPEETLPPGWACDGSTGYDFMDQVAGVMHDAAGGARLLEQWRNDTDDVHDMAQVEQAARREVLQHGLRAEFDALVALLVATAAEAGGAVVELGQPLLAAAATRLLVHFPVYRSYLDDGPAIAADSAWWHQAAHAARAGASPAEQAAIDQILDWLLYMPETTHPHRPALAAQCVRLRQQFQLLSAPLNAKAVEDCSFYRLATPLSRNEVGTHPAKPVLSAADFHVLAAARGRRYPRALLATATHDHKRGEDARMRLALLTRWPQWWQRRVQRLERLARPVGAAALHPVDRQLLWQTLVAAWPVDGADTAGEFVERLQQWQRKALREAGLRSSWSDPDDAYEARAAAVLEALLRAPAAAPLRHALRAVVSRLAPAGARLSLAQTALRLTVPGLPDLYQGDEGWDLSLVDPDNRRPVDYPQRRRWVRDPRPWQALLLQWHDGALKARLVHQLLHLRRTVPALFAEGHYVALPTTAPAKVLACARTHGGTTLVLVAAIGTSAGPAARATVATPAHFWGGARVHVPPGRYRNVLTGVTVEIEQSAVSVRALSKDSPVTLLITP